MKNEQISLQNNFPKVDERNLIVLRTSYQLTSMLGFTDYIYLDERHLPKKYPEN